jgi:ABC-2 type transport system ATP-binding protein
MLVAQDLWKSYGTKPAVTGVSLEVKAGEILGVLGPNGAGKSTTVSMLCGLSRPDRGTVTLGGEAIGEEASPVKRRIGLVPQDISLFEDFSTWGNLELFGALYGVEGELLDQRAHAALQLVGLLDQRKARPSTFSGGMKRRLNIACALVHDPDVLLLDEPTVGVDPQSRNAIFENLESLKARGKALVYTTHYMEEAERLCDRVVIIDHGKVIASDTTQKLCERFPPRTIVRASLEDVFLSLTGRDLRDQA